MITRAELRASREAHVRHLFPGDHCRSCGCHIEEWHLPDCDDAGADPMAHPSFQAPPPDAAEVERVWREEWLPRIQDEGHRVSIARLKGELYDLYRLVMAVPKVYAHVTGGLCQDPCAAPEAIIAMHDERLAQLTTALRDELEAARALAARAARDADRARRAEQENARLRAELREAQVEVQWATKRARRAEQAGARLRAALRYPDGKCRSCGRAIGEYCAPDCDYNLNLEVSRAD